MNTTLLSYTRVMNFTSEYVAPTLTVDSVIFQLDDNQLSVLLIERTQEPFAGSWALPGGYCAAGETTSKAMARILETKAGLVVPQLGIVEQLYTFDTVARDPRGHAVSVTYMGLGKNLAPVLNTYTQNPDFFPVNALPKLAYDHQHIIDYAHERLRSKLSYTNAVSALLSKQFTLSQLQAAYETVFGHQFDKRNFRKKLLSLNMIHETDEVLQDGAHRPARLFTFNNSDLQTLTRNFE